MKVLRFQAHSTQDKQVKDYSNLQKECISQNFMKLCGRCFGDEDESDDDGGSSSDDGSDGGSDGDDDGRHDVLGCSFSLDVVMQEC